MKTKTILLSYPHYDNRATTVEARNANPRVYRVEKATDSTEFNPGDYLDKAKVDELCDAAGWAVTIAKVRS